MNKRFISRTMGFLLISIMIVLTSCQDANETTAYTPDSATQAVIDQYKPIGVEHNNMLGELYGTSPEKRVKGVTSKEVLDFFDLSDNSTLKSYKIFSKENNIVTVTSIY
jgi:hypothetical protein